MAGEWKRRMPCDLAGTLATGLDDQIEMAWEE